MKLKLKHEFLDWSIGSGGKTVKRKLKNVHPTEFEKLYNNGYKEFFIVDEVKDTKVEIKDVKSNKNKVEIDDSNTEGSN